MEKPKGKNKSIIICEEIHEKLKRYCVGKGYKITPLVERMIIEFLERENNK
jgi:hypothetical protein